MWVSKVRMVNFMRYEDETVELHPGFNAIVGQTDSGKSTVLRALTWVFYNRPTGMEMCRDGTDETIVELTIEAEDGQHTVSRIRSKKRNAYELDGQAFDNVKTDVPLEIEQTLGIAIAEIGPKVYEMLNVSRQLDGPFMLTGSGGDAAKIMGNLAGITTLDVGLASIRPDLLTANKALTGLDKLEETYRISIVEFDDLDAEAIALDAVHSRLTKAQHLQQKLDGLTRVSARMTEYNGTVSTIDTDIAAVGKVVNLTPQFNTAHTLLKRATDLSHVLDKMAAHRAAYTRHTDLIADAEVAASGLQDRYKALLHEAGTCPTCGQTT